MVLMLKAVNVHPHHNRRGDFIAETKIQMFRKTPLYAFGNVCDQQRQHHKRSDGETTFRLTLYNVPNFETELFTSRRHGRYSPSAARIWRIRDAVKSGVLRRSISHPSAPASLASPQRWPALLASTSR